MARSAGSRSKNRTAPTPYPGGWGEGRASAGGVSVALSCDMRIAAEGAKFGVPAAKLGLGYEAKGVRKLMDVVGPSFAKEIFFTARQFTAEEAMAMADVQGPLRQGAGAKPAMARGGEKPARHGAGAGRIRSERAGVDRNRH